MDIKLSAPWRVTRQNKLNKWKVIITMFTKLIKTEVKNNYLFCSYYLVSPQQIK